MLDFSGKDVVAQHICIYYAEKIGALALIDVLRCKKPVESKKEARELSKFFWDMLDASAADMEDGVEVCGEQDLAHWMERNMNVFRGYLCKIGYGEEWEKVSDEV